MGNCRNLKNSRKNRNLANIEGSKSGDIFLPAPPPHTPRVKAPFCDNVVLISHFSLIILSIRTGVQQQETKKLCGRVLGIAQLQLQQYHLKILLNFHCTVFSNILLPSHSKMEPVSYIPETKHFPTELYECSTSVATFFLAFVVVTLLVSSNDASYSSLMHSYFHGLRGFCCAHAPPRTPFRNQPVHPNEQR